ncbi:MAG: hypothetical protein JO199_13430 [Candidatus Eremiobacteraeota bacterium]|nr:hypothetical protein [Candidatus Eremiobacteraeota bacterium]
MNGALARRSARISDMPVSTLLVEAGGRKLHAELRRLPGAVPRYALSIVNETPLCMLVSFRVRTGERERPIAPEVWVDPEAAAELSFGVSPFVAARGGTLVVRLVNARLQRELIAPLPGTSWLSGAVGGALAASVVAAAVSFAEPRIEVFAVPPVAVSNASLRVPYRTAGVGTATYALENERGATIESGTLHATYGTLALALPASERAANYTIRLRNAGALGVAEVAQPVTALPSATQPPLPLIEAMTVERSQISDGDAIDVRYRTVATRGRLVVRDAGNTVWAQAPLSVKGSTRLHVPPFGSNRELRVTLEAARGSQRASSTLGVSVIAAAPQQPPPPPDLQVARAFAGPSPVLVENQTVDPGSRLRAQIAAGTTHVRLTLETLTGNTVDAVTVPDGSTYASIPVPRGSRGELVLVATYDVGAGEESIVRRINVGPR